MSTAASAITAEALSRLIGTSKAPEIFNVCRAEAFAQSSRVIAGSRWRDPLQADNWARHLSKDQAIIVTCVHGHNVSQMTAARLREKGLQARFLEGGTEGFLEFGGPSVQRRDLLQDPQGNASRWITREKPKIDRLACPWFIRRFLDPKAEIYYVESEQVAPIAEELPAIAFDIDAVTFSHRGELCSFDTFLDYFDVTDESLRHLARIVRGADTARLDLEPECAGLLALSLGISAGNPDDQAALEQGMMLYDNLYAWIRSARQETHSWPNKDTSSA